MKSIVVYYSLEENTRWAAEKIAEAIGADLLRIEPVKPYLNKGAAKFIKGGRSAMMGEKPKLKSYEFNSDDYELIILGTPVWAGKPAPPINTFVSENILKNKKLALLFCSTGGDERKACMNLKKKVGITKDIPVASLIDPYKKQDFANTEKLKEFCQALTEE